MAKIGKDFIRRPPSKGCGRCELFDLGKGCSMDLRNPKTYTQTRGIIERDGFSAICSFNPFKGFIHDAYQRECNGSYALVFNS